MGFILVLQTQVNNEVINLQRLTSFGKWSSPFNGSRETLFADVNGDGKADAIAVNNKAVFVMTSDGTQFTNWGNGPEPLSTEAAKPLLLM